MPAGMVVGGAPRSRFDTPPIGPSNPMQTFGNPNTFTSAATQQASDYDEIMGRYRQVFDEAGKTPSGVGYSGIGPVTSPYQRSGEVEGSLRNLQDLSQTGGYSSGDIAALRERGISPIRSIYSSAQRGLDRQRALSGGYSPNYGAVTAKMARDQAASIGNQMNNVNAGIAQNVASNRLSAAPAYASAAENENQARTESEKHNADIVNQINQFNAGNKLSADTFTADAKNNQVSRRLGAAQGMTSLYGTTPALTNTFGNQVMQATDSNQKQQQINNNREATINNSVFGRFRNG